MQDKIHNILSMIAGAVMAIFGLNKFLQFMSMPEMGADASAFMGALGASGWFFPLLAVVEITGGIFLLLNKYRPLGAIVLFPALVGIVLFHLFMDPGGIVVGGVIFLIVLWTIVRNSDRYMHMIKG